jgi:hypothetical protein
VVGDELFYMANVHDDKQSGFNRLGEIRADRPHNEGGRTPGNCGVTSHYREEFPDRLTTATRVRQVEPGALTVKRSLITQALEGIDAQRTTHRTDRREDSGTRQNHGYAREAEGIGGTGIFLAMNVCEGAAS